MQPVGLCLSPAEARYTPKTKRHEILTILSHLCNTFPFVVQYWSVNVLIFALPLGIAVVFAYLMFRGEMR